MNRRTILKALGCGTVAGTLPGVAGKELVIIGEQTVSTTQGSITFRTSSHDNAFNAQVLKGIEKIAAMIEHGPPERPEPSGNRFLDEDEINEMIAESFRILRQELNKVV